MTYLYLMAADVRGPIKFGISEDPVRRLKEIQTGQSEVLHIVACRDIPRREIAELAEKLILSYCAPHRCAGPKEWFNMTTDEAAMILNFFPHIYEPSDSQPDENGLVPLRRTNLLDFVEGDVYGDYGIPYEWEIDLFEDVFGKYHGPEITI